MKSESSSVFGQFKIGYFFPRKSGFLNKRCININKHLITVVAVLDLKHIYLIDYMGVGGGWGEERRILKKYLTIDKNIP